MQPIIPKILKFLKRLLLVSLALAVALMIYVGRNMLPPAGAALPAAKLSVTLQENIGKIFKLSDLLIDIKRDAQLICLKRINTDLFSVISPKKIKELSQTMDLTYATGSHSLVYVRYSDREELLSLLASGGHIKGGCTADPDELVQIDACDRCSRGVGIEFVNRTR
jgi:hypothetical protein